MSLALIIVHLCRFYCICIVVLYFSAFGQYGFLTLTIVFVLLLFCRISLYLDCCCFVGCSKHAANMGVALLIIVFVVVL